MKAQGAAQFLGFTAGEISHDHGDAQELLLEERDAKGSLQDGSQAFVEIGHLFTSGASRQVRMNHITLDWAGTDDGDLDDHIIKAGWLQSRQGGHLRAAFDLEYANSIRLLHHLKGGGVIRRNSGEFNRMTALACERERVLDDGHHAEPEQIDFDDAEVFAIFLVPLRDDAAGHGSVFERDDRIKLALADNHAAGMLAQMTRQPINRAIELDERKGPRMVQWQAGLPHLGREFERVRKIALSKEIRETIQNVI